MLKTNILFFCSILILSFHECKIIMTINTRSADFKNYLCILICLTVAHPMDGMIPDQENAQSSSLLVPLAIGTACIVGAGGLYYSYKKSVKKKITDNKR